MKKETENETAYLKLELPKPIQLEDDEEKKWGKSATDQEEKLIEFLRPYCMIYKSGDRIQVNESMEDPCYEVTFELNSPHFNDFLITAIIKYLSWIDVNIVAKFRSTLVLHATTLFENKIVPTVADVRLSSLHFGNVMGNEFLDHWEVSFKNDHDKSRGLERRIVLDFEFDRPIMLLVKFRQMEIDYTAERKPSLIMHYLLQLHKNSIRRVICDTSHITAGLPRTRLYFEVNAPVVIRKGKNTLNAEKEGKKPRRFERVVVIDRGTDKDETSHQRAITDSRFFCIEFESAVDASTLYTILSRLRFRADVPIEFTAINKYRLSSIFHLDKNPYHKWTKIRSEPKFKEGTVLPTDHEEDLFSDFLKQTFIEPRIEKKKEDGSKRNVGADKMRERKFAYCYLIECLLSRGAVVRDQLLLEEENWIQFLTTINIHFNDDKTHDLCESALEDLISFVDSRKRVGNILKRFEVLCNERCMTGMSNQMTGNQYAEGYRRVRKVILTPTRMILIVPETIMSNRVLNSQDHDSTRIVRVAFRDDDNMSMRVNFMGDLLGSTVMSYMTYGITVAGREFGYLGSSNSQMRDNGAYFMEKYSARNLVEYRYSNRNQDPPPTYKPKILKFRKQLGKFEKAESIPKAMARMGQCFTQARVCEGVEIDRNDYCVSFDVIGGRDPAGEAYKYTDGVGTISIEMATLLSSNMKLGRNCVPSAYQIRFRGMKGMLAIDPSLDKISSNFRDLHRKGVFGPTYDKEKENEVLNEWHYRCVFRPSQIKFVSGRKEKYPIELVKYSSPTPVALNRPLINVLDHVSEIQSHDSHRRICGRIEELLDRQMASFAKFMINEDSCRQKLEEMPRRVNFATLSKTYGFILTTEPFFRSLIRAAINVTLAKLLRKTQIQVPHNLGRSMFGVTDETGRLQYGQVFVQYTTNIQQKTPGPTAHKTILNGQVLVTKCPSVVSGDVRMFDAVDIPELRHLNDVIVFPQHGPRPHPDEMAGSDLDGDEYSVIWDPELFLEGNEKAFNFSCDKVTAEFKIDEMDRLMHEFYVKYMEQDSVGSISLNHLYQSDQFGIESKVCNKLAAKLSQALDFVKSGHPPEPLTGQWTKETIEPNNEPGKKTEEMIPPERSERIPDYTTNQDKIVSTPMYTSSRLLGSLFRELKSIDDVMKLSEEQETEIIMDDLLVYEGWEEYQNSARSELGAYNAQMRSIMENYGIRSEAEIFSGCIFEMRNRISDKEQDDMSLFNTETVIEGKMSQLYRTFRERFFQEFGRENESDVYIRFTNVENGYRSINEKDVLRRKCEFPTIEMRKKAIAYYQVCYRTAIETGERKLSFGWLAYDVLNSVRGTNLATMDVEAPTRVSNPLFKFIEDHRKQFWTEKVKDVADLTGLLNNALNYPANNIEKNAGKVIRRYWKKYPDLRKVFLIFHCWAKSAGIVHTVGDGDIVDEKENLKRASNSRIQWYHSTMLLIMFATKKIGATCDLDVRETGKSIAVQLDQLDDIHAIEARNANPDTKNELTNSALNRLTIAFFQFLSSRQFRRLRYLSFQSLDVKSIFMKYEWLPLHNAAVKTYYNLLLNLRFEELPISTTSVVNRRSVVRECNPFVIELPANCDASNLEDVLLRKSKCLEVRTRALETYKSNKRFLISARGTIESMQSLRELVSVKIPKNSWCMDENLSKELSKLCYQKITGKQLT